MPQLPSPLSPTDARVFLDRALSTHGGIVLTDHFQHRGGQRSFDTFDAYRVLQDGLICLDEWDEKHRNWKYKVRGTDIEGDSLTLVVAFDTANQLVKVITGHG
jgi:Domain of unknown function (DUF4258)